MESVEENVPNKCMPTRIVPAILIIFVITGFRLLSGTVPALAELITAYYKNTSGIASSENKTNYEDTELIWDYIYVSRESGMSTTCVIGGIISERYGARLPVFYAVIASSFLLFLIPWAVMNHFGILIVFKFLIGMFVGIIKPSVITLSAQWSPLHERTMFTFCTFGSIPLITIYQIIHYLPIYMHWQSVCYSSATIVTTIGGVWYLFMYNSPSEHPGITIKELAYIKEPVLYSVTRHRGAKFPVWDALASINFILILCLFATHTWISYYIPLRIITAYQTMQTTSTGNLSVYALISIIYGASAVVGGFAAFADGIISSKKLLSLTLQRKIAVAFSHVIPGILMLTSQFLQVIPEIICLSIATILYAVSCAGHYRIPFDQAPNYAGTIIGMGLTVEVICGLLLDTFTLFDKAVITSSTSWNINSVLHLATGTLFIIIGIIKIETWNWPDNYTLRMVAELGIVNKLQEPSTSPTPISPLSASEASSYTQ